MFLLLKCISCHECLVVKHRKRHYPLSAIYIVCGFKKSLCSLSRIWSLSLSVSGAGEGEGGGRHGMLFSSDLWLIGRESVFRLVVAEAQTFVYITGGEMIPSSSIYPSAESFKRSHCLQILKDSLLCQCYWTKERDTRVFQCMRGSLFWLC